MSALPPIPIPAARRWAAFRTERLPSIVFALGVLGVAFLWNQSASAPTLIAEAEIVRTEVRAVQPGTLASLDVALLQPVTAGQVIGHVRAATPEVTAATLAIIRAEIELLRSNLEPVLPAQRVALDAARLQLDWMRERVTLASLRVQLAQAEADLTRLTPLHAQNLVSAEVFDNAKSNRANLAAQLTEQEKLVTTLAPAAGNLAAQNAGASPRSPAETLAAALKVEDEKLRLAEAQLGPVNLVAPISGIVLLVHRRAGEMIATGEPVITVAATESVRLVGFLRQPLPVNPTPGAKAEIRTRTLAREIGTATVLETGRVLEPVSPTLLALVNRTASPELGLRVHLSIPPELKLRPGEQVDVLIRD
jgi:multidrug resistance efflux pump